jgi:hypothetical protein
VPRVADEHIHDLAVLVASAVAVGPTPAQGRPIPPRRLGEQRQEVLRVRLPYRDGSARGCTAGQAARLMIYRAAVRAGSCNGRWSRPMVDGSRGQLPNGRLGTRALHYPQRVNRRAVPAGRRASHRRAGCHDRGRAFDLNSAAGAARATVEAAPRRETSGCAQRLRPSGARQLAPGQPQLVRSQAPGARDDPAYPGRDWESGRAMPPPLARWSSGSIRSALRISARP